MHKSTGLTFIFAMLIIFGACKNSSQDAIKAKRQEEMNNKENRVSPPVTATANIGSNTITIEYSSPAVKNRPIWGELVQYDTIWRTGANEATTVTFTQDVTIQGQPLAKDTYSFFTIPTDSVWTVIFNTTERQWGAFKYSKSDDALRVFVQPTATETLTENLTFSVVADAKPNTGVIRLNWEKLQLDCVFENAATPAK